MHRNLSFFSLALATALVFLLAGCGAGGGSSGSKSGLTPAVLSTSPANNATGLAINSAITATFNMDMNGTSISTNSFTLNNGATGVVSYAGTTATFTPSSTLVPSTTYIATINTAVQDTNGIPLSSNYTWSFTTGTAPDNTPPTVTSTSPAINATGVAVNAAITATFSEAVNASTVTAATFTVSNGKAVTGVVTYSGTTATFTPSSPLPSGASYTVTITSGVKDLAGNAMATNYSWSFKTISYNLWTWMSGSNVNNQRGVYGTQGSPAGNNIPGARSAAVSWLDGSGNRWIFGGQGYDSAGASGNLNDLWKYDGNNWSWVSGSKFISQFGVYGTQGTAAGNGIPGARAGSVSWIDGSGNLWLFGGQGYDSAGTLGTLNDLWKYDGSNWTWISGSNTINQKGFYGTQGTVAVGNIPGARNGAVSWVDASGISWLFGGYGYDSAGTLGYLNDLWKYDGSNWTWMKGGNVVNQIGVYGTKGIGGGSNIPGARFNAVSWIDKNGVSWLFGGNVGTPGVYGPGSFFNDLWKFDGSNWTWVSGSNLNNQTGVYGTQGIAAADNTPGARYGAVSWVDASGRLWLFGGWNFIVSYNAFNDLWQFDGSNWTWVSGSNLYNQTGVYGTQGIAVSGNAPGARLSAVSWSDGWLYGGAWSTSKFSDLWRYQP